jgi:hypothetical protein
MLKQLIRYESQFWPVQMGPYHFGLGHLTYVGASNALLWNRALFDDAYAQQVTDPQAVTSLSPNWPNQLLTMMDASCATCADKINISKAEQSIAYIAKVLLAYCRQTSQVVYNATKRSSSEVVDYATIWKLTLLNYNVGPLCVYNAVNTTYQSVEPDTADQSLTDDENANTNATITIQKLSWDLISSNIDDKNCSRGIGYVDNITRPYYDFK